MSMPLPNANKNHLSPRVSSKDENLKPEELLDFMNRRGISEKELGEILGVTIQGVKLWLSDKRKINLTITRLVRLFDKYPQLIKEF